MGDLAWSYWSEGEGIAFLLNDIYRGESSTLEKRVVGPGTIEFKYSHYGTEGNRWAEFYIDKNPMFSTIPPQSLTSLFLRIQGPGLPTPFTNGPSSYIDYGYFVHKASGSIQQYDREVQSIY